MSLALRPYQLEAISAIESSQASRQLVVLPTGSSKTVVFCELISRQPGLGHRPPRGADRPGGRQDGDGAPRHERRRRPGGPRRHAPVVVASVPTLLRCHGRMERIARGLSLAVVDGCDRGARDRDDAEVTAHRALDVDPRGEKHVEARQSGSWRAGSDPSGARPRGRGDRHGRQRRAPPLLPWGPVTHPGSGRARSKPAIPAPRLLRPDVGGSCCSVPCTARASVRVGASSARGSSAPRALGIRCSTSRCDRPEVLVWGEGLFSVRDAPRRVALCPGPVPVQAITVGPIPTVIPTRWPGGR